MEKRPKRRTRRADGKLFWGMKKNREIWITEQQFLLWEKSQKAYANKRAQDWQQKLPADQRLKRGAYDAIKDLYFYEYTGVGRPVWVTKEEFDRRKENARLGRRAYYYRLKKLPLPKYVPGDRNPDIPNLVVVRTYANKVVWGSEDAYKRQLESRSKSYKKYRANKGKLRKESAKQKKQKIYEFLKQNPHLRRSRGDKDLVLDRTFWGYSLWGTELWLSPEKYHQKSLNAKNKRNLLREKRKNERCQQNTN